MAAPMNTPLTGDIWHLSIDELLALMPEITRLGGAGPFVINLSSAGAPIALPTERIAGSQHTHMYQVQRTEDGRLRYRLRLGPFASEDEVDAILKMVREIYPGALTATADSEDLRVIALLQAKADALQSAVAKPAEKPAERAPEMSPPAAKPAAVPLPAPQASLPILDATQTVRALTQLELEDDHASHWFVIQLALAEDAFDPDAVPNLDIFSVYRLYSVAGIDQGRIVHALRLGFFSEQGAAGAVASYLAAYYDKPSIKRVSAAERERFADQRLQPRKEVGATGKHSVIEITSERFVRERRNAAPAGLVSQKSR
jgi:hypothetical protein